MRIIILILSLLIATHCYGSVRFNGDADYLWHADGNNTDISGVNQDISICLWMSSDNVGADQSMVNKYQNAQRSYSLEQSSDGGIAFTISSDGSSDPGRRLQVDSGAGDITQEQWHHVCGVYDDSASIGTIYIDGAADGTDTPWTEGIWPGTAIFEIGSVWGGTLNRFDGKLNEIAIWDIALTAAQVQYLAGPRLKGLPLVVAAANLQFYAPLDDNTPGLAGINTVTFNDLATGGTDVTAVDADNDSTTLGEQVLTYPPASLSGW